VRSRLKLRYAAASVVIRLLPACVAAFNGGSELMRWLGEMFDITEDMPADLLVRAPLRANARYR
jgi:hypothetical protein